VILSLIFQFFTKKGVCWTKNTISQSSLGQMAPNFETKFLINPTFLRFKAYVQQQK
jgi:hypothetical protein